tara:strand:- start:185 stop:751 length:567 start_codon:yes stop_codon:yes gene_type:complete
MNSGATAPEYGTVSSDFVKLHEANNVSAASEINLNGYFNDDYYIYKIFFSDYGTIGGDAFFFKVRTGTNGATLNSDAEYYWTYNYRTTTSGGTTQQGDSSGFGSFARQGWCGAGNANQFATTEVTIFNPANNNRTHFHVKRSQWDNGYYGHSTGTFIFNKANTPVTGLSLYHGSGNIALQQVQIYGLK